jgi:hypothetical protein
MPYLQHDSPAGVVYCVGDVEPAGGLLLRPDARGVRVSDALRADDGRFADDQSSAGSLRVVLRIEFGGHTPFTRSAAAKW